MQYVKSLIDEGFVGTPFIFNGYEQNSQWLDPQTPLRQVDHDGRPVGDPGVVARGLRRADHGPRPPVHGQPLQPGRRHDEELHPRARGARHRHDDADEHRRRRHLHRRVRERRDRLDPDQLRDGRQLSRHRGARLRQQGRAHLPAGRGERRRASRSSVATADSVEFREIEVPARFYPPAARKHESWRSLFYANLIRSFISEILSGGPENEGNFEDGAHVQELINAVELSFRERRWVSIPLGPVSGALDSFFGHYYRRRPVNATFTGVHMFDDVAPGLVGRGPRGARRRDARARARALASRIRRRRRRARIATTPTCSTPSSRARFSRRSSPRTRARTASARNPSLWTGEAIFSVIGLMIASFAPLDERIENAAARLDAIPAFLRRCAWRHWQRSVPRPWADRAIRECAGAEILLTRGIDAWLASDVHSARVAARSDAALIRRERRSRQFADWLRSLPDAPETSLACGAAMFDVLLARGHHCNRTRADLLADARTRFAAERARLDEMARRSPARGPPRRKRLPSDAPSAGRLFRHVSTHLGRVSRARSRHTTP